MSDLSGFLQHMIQSAAASATGGNQADRGSGVGGFLNSDFGRGGLAGGALGLLLGGDKKTSKLASYGGLAALGMMVFEAYSQYQKQQQGAEGAAGATTAGAAASPLGALAGSLLGGGAQAAGGGAGGLLGAALGALGGAASSGAGGGLQSALVQAFTSQLAARAPQTIDRVDGAQAAAHSTAILRALIAAAKADGHIDERERTAIEAEYARAGLDASAQQWLSAELQKPLDAAEVARAATSPEMAGEMYLASLMVVDEQNAAERAYLQSLGQALGLPEGVQQQLQQQLLKRQQS